MASKKKLKDVYQLLLTGEEALFIFRALTIGSQVWANETTPRSAHQKITDLAKRVRDYEINYNCTPAKERAS